MAWGSRSPSPPLRCCAEQGQLGNGVLPGSRLRLASANAMGTGKLFRILLLVLQGWSALGRDSRGDRGGGVGLWQCH